MATAKTYKSIPRPYDDFLNRDTSGVNAGEGPTSSPKATAPNNANASTNSNSSSSSSNGYVEPAAVRSDVNMSDLWIKTFIRSENWKPKVQGFYIDGRTGYAEFANVYLSGEIVAQSGSIGGFSIGATEIYSVSGLYKTSISSGAVSFASGLELDPSINIYREGKMELGASNPIILDGLNTQIRSTNYVSGAFGSGFLLSSNLLEVGNIACRGMFRTAVFQKDVINVIAGSFVVAPNGDVLDADMTSLESSTLTLKGTTTLAVGDILRLKESNGLTVDDEWMQVTDVYAAPTYTVLRDMATSYPDDANPAWKKGTAVVDYGQPGQGGVYMTASDTNAPYLSVYDHTGSPWSSLNTRLRLGNLNGYLGYTTDLYGIGIGDATNYLKYDITNGLRIAGNIAATTGTIGGWVIGPDSLTDAAGAVGMSSAVAGGDDVRFWAGDVVPANAEFRVTESGVLFSSAANITGAVTATSGTVGSFTIGTYLYTGAKLAYNDGLAGVHIGADGIGMGNEFSVSAGGHMICVSASITGTITALSGTIGSFTIGTYLYSGSKTLFNDGLAGVHIGSDGIGLGTAFAVSAAGIMTASGGTITGGTIQTSVDGYRIKLNGSTNRIELLNGNTVKAYITTDSSGDIYLNATDDHKFQVGGSTKVQVAGSEMRPGSDNAYGLGASDKEWSNIYGHNIRGNHYFAAGVAGATFSGYGFITSIDFNGRQIRAKYRELTVNNGIITALGAETGWIGMDSMSCVDILAC